MYKHTLSNPEKLTLFLPTIQKLMECGEFLRGKYVFLMLCKHDEERLLLLFLCKKKRTSNNFAIMIM